MWFLHHGDQWSGKAILQRTVDKLEEPIRLEPMTKFPVVRDLAVDRSRMFDALKKVQAWVPADGYHDLGPGERISPEHQHVAYKLSELSLIHI